MAPVYSSWLIFFLWRLRSYQKNPAWVTPLSVTSKKYLPFLSLGRFRCNYPWTISPQKLGFCVRTESEDRRKQTLFTFSNFRDHSYVWNACPNNYGPRNRRHRKLYARPRLFSTFSPNYATVFGLASGMTHKTSNTANKHAFSLLFWSPV